MAGDVGLELPDRGRALKLHRAAQDELRDAELGSHSERWHRAVETKLLDLSPNSRRAYRRELERWTAFVDAVDGIEPFDATVAHARAYRTWLLENQGLAPSSVARALAALSGIYLDVAETAPELGSLNPFRSVRRPKLDRVRSTPSLSVDEAREFIDAARNLSPRAYALVLLLLGTGLRLSEALAADIGDLRVHQRGTLVLTVTRKGGQTAHVGLPAPVVAALDGYFRSRISSQSRTLVHACRAKRFQSQPLFVGANGRMSANEVRRELERTCRACAWPAGRVTAHGLRHTFATTAVEDCEVQVRAVQHALGHATAATTETYLHDDRFSAAVNDTVTDRLLDGAS